MKVIILGAGASGLAAAYELSKYPDIFNNIQVLEKENFVGGLASSHSVEWDGQTYHITKTYHHILDGDMTYIDLINELGLGNHFHKKRVKQGFLYKNKIWGLSTPWDFLIFPISLRDKLRLLRFVLKISRKRKWDDVEGLSAKDWIIKEVGQRNYEVFFESLVRNKFNTSASEISATWLGTRLEREPRSFLKKMGWLEGGYHEVFEVFVKKLRENKVDIKTQIEVKRIEDFGTQKKITYVENGKEIVDVADIVISTIPPKSFLRIYENPSRELKEKFNKIDYLGAACACMGMKRSFMKHYWINILDRGLPFVVIFEYTNLYETLAPKGKSVFYLLTYFKHPHELWEKSEQEIFDVYINALEKVFPGCKEAVDWYRVVKFSDTEAIYSLNYENPPIEDKGIYFAGIFRFYPKIRDVSSALESGFEAAEKIKEDFNVKSNVRQSEA